MTILGVEPSKRRTKPAPMSAIARKIVVFVLTLASLYLLVV